MKLITEEEHANIEILAAKVTLAAIGMSSIEIDKLENLQDKINELELQVEHRQRVREILKPIAQERGLPAAMALTEEQKAIIEEGAADKADAGIYKAGDIVAIRPKALVYTPVAQGGRPWGMREKVDFAIVTFANLTESEANALVEPVSYNAEKTTESDEPEIITHEVMVGRRRHRMNITDALTEYSPATLVDTEKHERFYRKDNYEDVEQPLQNGNCCLKHVVEMTDESTMSERQTRMQEHDLQEDNTLILSQPEKIAITNIKGKIIGSTLEPV
jgi:hypothetical protein